MTKENGHCPKLMAITLELHEFEEYLEELLGGDCYAHDYAQVGNEHFYLIESNRLDFIKTTLYDKFKLLLMGTNL
jgi:hypothetical protein